MKKRESGCKHVCFSSRVVHFNMETSERSDFLWRFCWLGGFDLDFITKQQPLRQAASDGYSRHRAHQREIKLTGPC